MYYLPDDEFDFFNLFRMEGVLYAEFGEHKFKHNLTILKWYDQMGFVVKRKEGDVHIVAEEYYDNGVRFKLWVTGDVIKVGGVVDDKGNFSELWREFEYGNPLPLRKTDPEMARLKMPEVIHVLPLVDMLKLFQNVQRGIRIDAGKMGDTLTQIFNVKIRDTTRVVPNEAIKEKVNYYLYYDDSLRLNGIERRNEKGATLTFKINRRSTYLLDKDIIILREIEHNH